MKPRITGYRIFMLEDGPLWILKLSRMPLSAQSEGDSPSKNFNNIIGPVHH